MHFHHRFVVSATLEQVRAFHADPRSMSAITPPPVIVRVHSAPQSVSEGAEMDFTLWLGPLPVRWRARFEEVQPTGFVDRQVAGPYAEWVHRHTFVELTDDSTEVRDDVRARVHPKGLWRWFGYAMWLNLPVLFAFRQWRTRQLLHRSTHPAGRPAG